MNAKNLKILLDNPQRKYIQGQTINGQVRVTVESVRKVQGMYEMLVTLPHHLLSHFQKCS